MNREALRYALSIGAGADPRFGVQHCFRAPDPARLVHLWHHGVPADPHGLRFRPHAAALSGQRA